MSTIVKSLTICQPYASLIVNPPHVKRVENRRWHTAYRGPLIIHAGKSRDWLRTHIGEMPDPMPFGKAIGACMISHCVGTREALEMMPTDENKFHVSGPWCFVLESFVQFTSPVSCSGFQGFWGFNVDQLAEHDRELFHSLLGEVRT